MTRAAIKHGEERLGAAMLAGDIEALDELLDDAAIFAGPDGTITRKEEDLEFHRSGAQRLTKVTPRDLFVHLHGDGIGIASAIVELGGAYRGRAFSGTYRYVRTWRRGEDGVWRVIAGAVIGLAD